MSLTALSNELEITPGSSPNTHLARAGWRSRGFLTWLFFGKPPLVWKSSPWPTDVVAPAIGGSGLNDAGAFSFLSCSWRGERPVCHRHPIGIPSSASLSSASSPELASRKVRYSRSRSE